MVVIDMEKPSACEECPAICSRWNGDETIWRCGFRKDVVESSDLEELMEQCPLQDSRMYLPTYVFGEYDPERGTVYLCKKPDFIEVVRCRDCRFYNGLAECVLIGECMGTNGFCSWGERKEEDV